MSPPHLPADTFPAREEEPCADLPQREVVTFDHFSIRNELGSGAFGKVDTYTQCLSKDFLRSHNQLEYWISECRSLQHPFVMRLHFALQTKTSLYMVLDYCPNGDLLAHLCERKRFETVALLLCRGAASPRVLALAGHCVQRFEAGEHIGGSRRQCEVGGLRTSEGKCECHEPCYDFLWVSCLFGTRDFG